MSQTYKPLAAQLEEALVEVANLKAVVEQKGIIPPLSAELIAELSDEQRAAELKARLGGAYRPVVGANVIQLVEALKALDNFVLSTPIPKPGGAPSSEATPPAPAATPPAPAAAPAAPASAPKAAATPPALAVSGLDRAVLALARKRTPAAK